LGFLVGNRSSMESGECSRDNGWGIVHGGYQKKNSKGTKKKVKGNRGNGRRHINRDSSRVGEKPKIHRITFWCHRKRPHCIERVRKPNFAMKKETFLLHVEAQLHLPTYDTHMGEGTTGGKKGEGGFDSVRSFNTEGVE